MAISIGIKTNHEESSETMAANQLKKQLEKELSGISQFTKGEILIISNITLFGQETKDIDIVMIGILQNFKLQINSNAKDKNNIQLQEIKRDIYINSFCYVIEVKDHSYSGVKQDGLNLLVKYNQKWSDATSQSEKQKYALVNYLFEHLGFSPNICNFIWLKNISSKELLQLNQNHKDNLLPSSFSLIDIVTKSTYQSTPFKPDNQSYCIINCVNRANTDLFDLKSLEKVFNLFSEVRMALGELTRKKIEQITSISLDKQQYGQYIGKKLTIIAGRAGTGKTVRLLRIACDLAVNKGSRSLILTYNHALVSDIRRVLALAGIPDGVDSYTVQISTLHKFFFQIFRSLGLGDKIVEQEGSYNDNFQKKMVELFEFLGAKLIDEKDIQELMKKEHEAVGWDYILIDEAQDWNDVEKKVLFKIFGQEKIVVADGVDQFIRGSQKQIWTRGIHQNNFHKKTETKGLRQKYNLVNFVNCFARVSGLTWEVTPDEKLYGGRIIISTKPYNADLHKRILADCIADKNSAYDMLILTPPNLVDRSNPDRIHFKQYEEYLRQGIKVYDGTNNTIRTQYPTNLELCRLFQYDSCRGLEGWTAVCLDFDQLFQYKMDSYVDVQNEELTLESPEERANRFVSLWTLMPLTRAIDTLVITLSDSNGEMGRRLKEVGKKIPDVIEWE
jgi:hypothetical protein